MNTYKKNERICELHSFIHYKTKTEFCAMCAEAQVVWGKNKTTITLKLKQVRATHNQQIHTGIAKVYTITQSHIAAYLNSK